MKSFLAAFFGGGESTTLLSFCAEQQPRGLEEERGRWLRGLAALVLPLPSLPHTFPHPGADNFPSLPFSKGALLWGGGSSGRSWPEGGGKRRWCLRSRP